MSNLRGEAERTRRKHVSPTPPKFARNKLSLPTTAEAGATTARTTHFGILLSPLSFPRYSFVIISEHDFHLNVFLSGTVPRSPTLSRLIRPARERERENAQKRVQNSKLQYHILKLDDNRTKTVTDIGRCFGYRGNPQR